MFKMKENFLQNKYLNLKQHQSLNKEIKQLESKLNLTDAQHDEKLETIKMNIMN